VGIEDFIIGFAIGGIAAVICCDDKTKTKRKIRKRYVLPIFAALFLGAYFLGLSSFYATTIAAIVSAAVILFIHPELTKKAALSGAVMMAIGAIAYWIMLIAFPEFIERFWYLDGGGWYRYLVLGIPLGEFIWYFVIGAFIAALYGLFERDN
jgi:hypothetical protein